MSYDNFAHTFSNSRKNHPWPELDYIINDMRKQWFSSILDIWCGNGRFLEEARKWDFTPWIYLGIDNSEWMVEEARKLHPEYNFEVIWMQDIKKIPERYGAILFLASFHHLETREERVQVIKECKNILNPTGCIYMTNWNLLWQERYQKNHRWNGDFDIKIGEFSRYYHWFTLDELAQLFEEAGLWEVEDRIFEGGRNIISILSL